MGIPFRQRQGLLQAPMSFPVAPAPFLRGAPRAGPPRQRGASRDCYLRFHPEMMKGMIENICFYDKSN